MILLGISGGIDSMCLAHKVRLEGGPFAIAHCNFRLRGAESDADEAFVRAWASEAGVTCHVKAFDTEEYASAEGISVEMAARKLRYRWFGELCTDFGYEAVAVAHNANDNAETLILNLLRGTGMKGLLGMKASGFLPDPDYSHIPLLRPLLGMTRASLEAYAAENGIPWREDSTNASNDYKRNKIRNLVFPVFREINPRFVETLNHDMERFSEEFMAEASSGTSMREPFGPSALVPPTASGSGPLPLMRPRVATGSLILVPDEAESRCLREIEFTVTEEPWDAGAEMKQPEGMLIMDADKAGEWFRGQWETGDWIRPLGAPGKKKMQDWFTDHHVPAWEKPYVPLIKSSADHHHVLAVVGRCIDHSVRVSRSTRRIIRISVKND